MSLITITSGVGCKANDIAKNVSKELNLEFYDNQKIEIESKKLNALKEHKTLTNKDFSNSLDKILFRNPEYYSFFMENFIDEITKKGKGIISGNASYIINKDFYSDLKILINAPLEIRILNIMREIDVSREDAEKIIRFNDKRQKDFLAFIYKTPWESVELYDLAINTSKINVQHASELIINTIKSNAIKNYSKDILNGFKKISLEKRISSLLAFNNLNINDLKIKVDEDGFAVINGYINNKKEKKIIQNVVKKIGGILKIKTELRLK